MAIVASGTLTITDVNDGLSVNLTKEHHSVPTNPDGSSPNFTGAATTVSVFYANVDESAAWTLSATPGSGLTGTLAGKTYTITGLTVDSSYVDLTVSRSGYTSVTKRFSVTKNKKGNRGSVTAARAIAGTTWSDTEAANAIAAVNSDSPAAGDVVTLHNAGSAYSETRTRTAGATWSGLSAFFGGDVVVDGTLTGDKLVADTISASKLRLSDNQNLIPNGDFSDGIEGWARVYGSVTFSSTATGPSRYAAVLTRTTTENTLTSFADFNTSGERPGIAVNAGDRYLLECWVHSTVAGNFIPDLVVRLPGGTLSTANFATTVMAANTWTKIAVTAVCPSHGKLFLRLQNSINSSTLQISNVRLLRKNGAELVVDGTIDTNHLAADSIDASKIQTDAITASKITITDITTDLVQDSEYRDLAAWGALGTVAFSDNVDGFWSERMAQVVNTTSTYGIATSKTFTVEPLEEYTYWAQARIAAGAGQGYIQMMVSAKRDMSSPTFLTSAFFSGAGITTLSGTWTVPAGYRFAQLRLIKNNDTATDARFSKVKLKKKTNGALIVDGTITTNHLAADSVDATKIQADAITASKLTITDGTTDIIPDSEYTDASAWPNAGGTGSSVVLTLNTDGFWSENMARVLANSGQYGVANGRVFVVEPLELYDFWGQIRLVSGTGVGYYQLMLSAKKDMSSPIYLGSSTVSSGTVTTVSGTWTVPAGYRFARLQLVKINDTSTEVRFSKLKLKKKVQGDLVVDGTIVTDKLGAGVVTADKVATNAITAKQLNVGDFSNLLSGADNPTTTGFLAGTAGSWGSGVTYNSKPNALQVLSTGANPAFTLSNSIPVTPGDEYYLEFWMRRNASWNGTAPNSKVRIMDQASALQFSLSYAAADATVDVWAKRSAAFVIPSGMNAIQINLHRDATAGACYLSDLVLRKKAGGELIVDGTIKTTHLEVTGMALVGGTLQSTNYVAGTSGFKLTQGGFAEFGSVNVRSTAVYNSFTDLTLNANTTTTVQIIASMALKASKSLKFAVSCPISNSGSVGFTEIKFGIRPVGGSWDDATLGQHYNATRGWEVFNATTLYNITSAGNYEIRIQFVSAVGNSTATVKRLNVQLEQFND